MNKGRIDENPFHRLIAIGNGKELRLGVCIRADGKF